MASQEKTIEHISPFAVITAALIIAGFWLLLLWIYRYNAAGLKPFILPAGSFVLFSYGMVRCVGALEEQFGVKKTVIHANTPRFAYFTLFVWIVFVNCLLLSIALKSGGQQGAFMALESFYRNHTDAPHYLDIAQGWYVNSNDTRRLDIVFFPLFPAAIRAVKTFVYCLPASLIAVLLNAVFSFFAGVYFYRLCRCFVSERQAARALKYMFIAPPAFFFFWPMAESLFLLVTVLFFYYLREKKFMYAALFGCLAALTRSQGVLLCIPAAASLLQNARNDYLSKAFSKKAMFNQLPCVFAPAVGFSLYLLLNYRVYGNMFQFLTFQKEHWSQSISFFWNTAKYIPEYIFSKFLSGETYEMVSLFIPMFISFWAVLALIVYGAKKLPFVFTVYGFAYFAVTYGATWLLSGARYSIVLFPIFISVSYLTENRKIDKTLTAMSLVCYFAYLSMYIERYPIY